MTSTISTTKLVALGVPRKLREQRVFRCHYECLACTAVGSEWTDELLTAGPSYCPCCDAKCEPYSVEAFCEERPEFDLDDED